MDQILTSKYKKILLDLDGTVIDRNEKLDDEVLNTLRRAKNNISISFCTGRTLDFVHSLAKHIGLESNHIVDDGSRVINKFGNELWVVILPQEVINYYLDLADKYQFNISASVSGKQKLKITREDKHISRLFPYNLNKKHVEILTYNIFSADYEAKVVWYDERTGYNVSIAHIKGNKKYGIEFLFQYEKLHQAEVVGVGDGINDLPMFESVGYSVAMGNATANIKALVDYVAPPVEQNGIIDVLKKIGAI